MGNPRLFHKKHINFLSMTLGAVLLAIGIYFLKSPNGFATGEVTGIGTLLAVTLIPPAVWIRAHI